MNLSRNVAFAPDEYDRAFKAALSAKGDWPAMLGYAQTLAKSPDWRHTNLARHIRDAYSLKLQGLLKPAPQPTGRIRRALGVLAGAVAFAAVSWAGIAGVML